MRPVLLVALGLAPLLLGCLGDHPENGQASTSSPQSKATDLIEPLPNPSSPDSELKHISVGTATVAYFEGGPVSGPDVLLLHGVRFTKETWQELGTLEALSASGAHFVAVDLPGFGMSPAAEIDRNSFLVQLASALGLEQPLVVSPSMSGNYSIPAAIQGMSMAGLVAVAPLGLNETTIAALAERSLPIWAVWGSEDLVVPVTVAKALVAGCPATKLTIFEGAGHPSYLDDPKRFNQLLVRATRGQ